MSNSVATETMDRGIHVPALDKKITALSDALAHLSSANDLRELLKIIRNPGWTTPAEFMLVMANLNILESQVRNFADQTKQLVEAARQVR